MYDWLTRAGQWLEKHYLIEEKGDIEVRKQWDRLLILVCARECLDYLQDKATTGKQGLGIKDRPKKVAGCYFEGKKTSFNDSDNEDASDNGSPKEGKLGDMVETEVNAESKVKLKKLCKQLLRQVRSPKLITCYKN